MNLVRNLSLRYKTPLRVSVLVIITAVLVTGALVLRERDELRRDLVTHSESMGRVLSRTLVEPMLHDDVWRAFELINTPFQAVPRDDSSQGAEIVMVLDAKNQVYVSTRPGQYPMLSDPARTDPEFVIVQQTASDLRTTEPTAVVAPNSNKLYMVVPIISDGVPLGTLVMGYSGSVFAPRFYALIKRAAVITSLVLVVLLPAGWYWGRRIAGPLVELASAMEKVGPHLPEEAEYQLMYESKDEIGRLGTEFKRMVSELKEKEALKEQMVIEDRLAAIGRLTAGIAHEINNPLGGMLNAISTFKRHGPNDLVTVKTLSLVERGLTQIKETLAALLVEAKVESHSLTRQDIEDTRTLVLPDAHGKSAHLIWENDIIDTLPLPSTLVRQILLNLLLNAVQAIEPSGHVYCHTYRTSGSLCLLVKNDGGHIPAGKLHYLFEPFSLLSEDGHGLGLWVTYQIVQQLGGDIGVRSEPGETQFTVSLPLSLEHERELACQVVLG
jgi:two-component system NtrC family sensor kinase